MHGTEHRTFSLRLIAGLTPLLFLLAALIALASGLVGPSSASAKTPCTPQNRAWENCGSAARQKLRNTVRPAQQEHLTLIGQIQWQATTKTHKTSGSAGGATAIPAPHAGIPSTFQQLVIYPIHPTVSHFGRDPPVRFRRTIRYDRSARYGVAVSVFVAAESAGTLREGSFSIGDWSGYPQGAPQPQGPFRLLEGEEFETARDTANAANKAIHDADPSLAGQHIHEVQPVKFGGSPTDPANKIPLSPQAHQPFTNWWNALMRNIRGG